MKQQKPQAAPLIFTRADPDELARFDDKKVCTMNCGPTIGDPRSDRERRFLCDDCWLPNHKIGGE
jgi:hypothetical protein